MKQETCQTQHESIYPSFQCPHCGKQMLRKCAMSVHVYSCKSNPERKPHKGGFKKGRRLTDEHRSNIGKAVKGRITSPEVRKKISQARIEFLRKNPDKVPYLLNHKSKGESYPERYFREVLTRHGVSFIQELRVSVYRIDFAIGSNTMWINQSSHQMKENVCISNLWDGASSA
jgi:hypothetical protein